MTHGRPGLIEQVLPGDGPGLQHIRELGHLAASYVDFQSLDLTAAPDLHRLDRRRRELVSQEFHHFIDIERHLQSDEPERALPFQAACHIRGGARLYHDLLPFYPSEVDWLVTAYGEAEQKQLPHSDPTRIFTALRRKRGWVSKEGNLIVDVEAKQLTNHWWDWRRTAGEFDIYGTYGYVGNVLRDLGGTILGDHVDSEQS
jgi:hypothetical protein